ncbi:DUF6220 domain-containing protein [Paenibacillus sp. BC26]|uniref:DUF6220 domain-containing protein n=1 Tax=Paenibacillus sp. BC26 TaxID=1881032 RepID=UPI0008E94C7B|nr:DUF6220 domain-containing protein [Paenibacillus sp. BC26]SFT21908.1 hypothetical protein SAMN05428962_5396 [Paenibacillus sp. BC26]
MIRLSKIIYYVLAWLFGISLFTQVFLAGLAVFDNGDWSMHKSFIHYFEFVPIAMIVFALIGRMGWRSAVLSALLYACIIFQYISVNLDTRVIAAIHPVTALLMLWGTLTIIRRSNPWKPING